MTLLAIFEALVGANAIWETTVNSHNVARTACLSVHTYFQISQKIE